jgi:excisionase family DNA binding protein
MGNLRPLIVSTAILLVLLSVPPLRRRLPGVRVFSRGLELLVWLVFVFLCLAALAGVEGPRATDLRLALERASLNLAGQSVGSLFAPATQWVSAHQPGFALVTAGAVALGWVCVGARAAVIFGRALTPHPRLGDWWPVDLGEVAAPGVAVRPASPIVAAAFVDVQAAALYLGVSRTTVYRWARAGRLRCSRTGNELRFSSDDLAALRRRGRPRGARRTTSSVVR